MIKNQIKTRYNKIRNYTSALIIAV